MSAGGGMNGAGGATGTRDADGAAAGPVVNIAACLPEMAARRPEAIAVWQPDGRAPGGATRYRGTSYRELDVASDVIARGLAAVGIGRGVRTVLMVPPGPDFFTLAFGMAKAGVVPVMVDPGMGAASLKTCIAEAEPEAFIGVPKAHLARAALGWGRATVKTTLTVGGLGLLGGLTLDDVRAAGRARAGTPALTATRADELAAILFTSGSTGVPKGVVYTHGNFAAQVDILRRLSNLGPNEIDLPTFPLFALFDPALGMTTVVPEMDFARPADADPARIAAAIRDRGVTSMFASPALLASLVRWGVPRGLKLPSLRRVISAGAPVPIRVVERLVSMLPPEARVITPYGATEALPVSTIASDEILGDTRARTEAGGGVCVGRPVAGVEVATIPISEAPIAAWTEALRLPPGEVGEIAVKGPVVTRRYWNREASTALAKIPEGDAGAFWHRMGDLGVLDEDGRLWFYGRKSQRVQLADGRTLHTVPCEGVFNTHPQVRRTALVGARRDGAVVPVVCVELEPESAAAAREPIVAALRALAARHPPTAELTTFLFHAGFPVDARHNAKIGREELSVWATEQLGR